MKMWKTIGILSVLLGVANTAQAWDDTGHQVVASIAWDNMTPAARLHSVALLNTAPADSGLQTLRRASTHNAQNDRAFFLRAATWADEVRDQKFPERREKHHRGNWHYINYFWEETADGSTRQRLDLKPEGENAVERLQLLTNQLRDSKADTSTRSIALAWILHLVGDIHQPLHTSARVTSLEPKGDRGGNDFKLAGDPENLHFYWDSILGLELPRVKESEEAYINRITGLVVAQHPKGEYSHQINSSSVGDWAREGFETARNEVYRDVERGQVPGKTYREKTFRYSSRAIALAGYRLADVLNRAFANSYSYVDEIPKSDK